MHVSRGFHINPDNLTEVTTYSYDHADRLSKVQHKLDGGATVTLAEYAYDDLGRLQSKKLGGTAYTATFAYNIRGWLTGIDGGKFKQALTYNNDFEFKDGAKQADEYAYDANGNLTKDLNKNITNIRYNFLNLPIYFSFKTGGFLQHGYTADGVRRRTIYKELDGPTSPVTTVYCGNVIYENNVPRLLLHEEGYVDLTDNSYHYYVKDHQGNNCLVVDSSGAVEEANHYYPFGGVFASTGNVQPYKYNGKELDTEKGLNWYDYGARMYDPALGRFHTNDRFAEKYLSMSPYQYGANNPIRNIDVDGDSIIATLTAEIDGKMTNINYTYRTDANGGYGFFDAQGNKYSGDNSFMNSLTDALNSLRAGKVGNTLVGELMNSSNIVNIANRKTNSADPNGGYILWNPFSTEGGLTQNGSTNRPPYIGLGHEMVHIQDIWRGTYDKSTWFNVQGKNIPNAEKYATHIENQIRSEHDLSLRAYYTNQPYSEACLLIPKTRASIFYKQVNLLGTHLIPTTPYVY